ncbi:MAG TPA: 2TM domain-containing protein [Thermoplasmatales archaeon]|nr:2TM domain-containing protein [Thermoplasmatales archaeon]
MGENEEIIRKAEKRAEDKLGFYIHFAIYLIVNIMLFLIWLFITKGFPWFLFPLGGWGIGVTFHFLAAFVFSENLIYKKMVEKEIEKLKRGR